MRAVLTLLGCLAACSFQPGAASSTGDGGDGGSDGADAVYLDAALPVARCGTPGAIRDNFEDGTAGTAWLVDTTGGAVVEQAGRLSVTPASTQFAGYFAKHYVDLVGAETELEVTGMVDTGTSAIAGLYLVADTTHYLALLQSGGQLTGRVVEGGNDDSSGVIYDPAERYWRISEASGTIRFETSPDRTTWHLVHTAATPTWANTLRITLGARGTGAATVGTASFDNVNTQVATADWCKADSFSDAFARSTVGYDWGNSGQAGTGCSYYVSSGAHADQFGAPSRCWFGASPAYDLTESSVTMRINAITNYKTGWLTFLEGRTDDGLSLRLDFEDNQMCAVVGTMKNCVGYSTANVWWRISETGGDVTFETSANKATWSPVATMPDPFDLTALGLRFGTDSSVDLSLQNIGLTFSSYN